MIKADYHHAINYRSYMEPLFESTPTSFFVTFYNLNYNVPVEKLSIDLQKVAIDIAIGRLKASQKLRKANIVKENCGVDFIGLVERLKETKRRI